MIDLFRPDYLAIGIEVNKIRQLGAEPWRAYAERHRHIYRTLRKVHPQLPIFASFTLHGMLKQEGATREGMLTAFREIMPENDPVAVSFYPFMRGGTTDIIGCLSWLDHHLDRYSKPYAFVETGEAAERNEFPKCRQIVEGKKEKQRAFYECLLRFASQHDSRFVICFLHRGFDALWEKIKQSTPEAFLAWQDCGLRDEADQPRPALAVWERYRNLPMTESAQVQ
jgi:hypothetical protein